MPPVAERGRGELGAVTALRFVLAFYALLYHVLYAWSPVVSLRSGGPMAALVSAGYVSVNGFFVLSGFVLAYVYADHARGSLPTFRAGGFLWARFARIYPMHVVGMLLSVPLLLTAGNAAHAREAALLDETWREVGCVALLVQAWIPERALDLNGPSWSLSVEAFFYACFPFLLRWLVSLRVRSLGVAAAAAFGVALLIPLVHPLQGGIEGASPSDRFLLYDPLVHLPEFVLGVTTGLAFTRIEPGGRRWKLASALAGLALLATLELSPALPAGLLHNGLLDPLLALLVFALAAGWGPSPPRRRLGLLGVLGRASYSLYILHKPVYLWMARESGLGRRVPSGAFVAAYVGVSLVVSVACWRGVEEPARRWLRSSSGGHRA